MQAPTRLGEFLEQSGARYRLFDLGSQLRRLSKDDWQRFDQGGAYPYPHLNHAWLVLLLWHPDNREQHAIWFMKLPLDEQAGLPAPVATDVLNRFMKALATTDTAERQRLLTDHPYQFKPDDAKMAALHARAGRILGAPTSQYYAAAQDYLLGSADPESWPALGLQGLAEVLESVDDKAQQQLAKRLPELPDEPRHQLLQMLEHHRPTLALADAIIAIADAQANETTDTCAVRAVSQSDAIGLVRAFISRALNRHTQSLDLVLAIFTRHPALLDDTELSLVALDRLAQLADQDGFNRVVQGLALQPGLSGLVLKVMRHPNRSDALARAIGGLINASRSVQ
ncbi:hypothetical protein BGP77_01635 [Saccharospirillum sp. MSK14-1]|uniref:DUF3549 family protein n=1 Tax=Saccharospirillum sp. MSK14-1 TaxID=1897632 RepID=UPI000D366F01|nr:DUF3549 family protein [Saccharospirillum sp. MSK14-1]PTY36050.1 hypothetical protein BGP77_01635 [Saccharospirillum sp. MSK14-1]